ncbi:MAG: LLM class flavin-dependent oxidoreductase [Deltaproteobacteria bacterium]|nr:LLM class flavin-dependent oxidoreductase [Deltaproteobacteria bacterium]
MDFGLQLATLPVKQLLETARNAEAWGYAALYVPDHWVYERQGGGDLDDTRSSWEATTILGAIGAVTSKARIGALVLCNLYRHPGTTAQSIVTLDHVSGGRATLGIGSGWTKAEFDMMGMEFPEVKPRLRKLAEAVRIIKSLWSESRTTFKGEFYELADALIVPKPVQQPYPPVMLGGSGKGVLRIAAREADHVNIISDAGRAGTVLMSEVAKVTEDAFQAKIDFVRTEARAAGRNPDAITFSSTIFMPMITETEAKGEEFAAGMGAAFGLTAQQVKRMPMALIGTPDECVAELKRREREWGTKHYILSGFGGPDLAERFAREIASRV